MRMVVPADCAAEFTGANTGDEEGCVLRGRGSIQGKRLTITMVTVVDPITERSQKAMKEVD